MKPKKIQVELGTPIERWADENRGLIMDSIYYNLSEFIESEEDDRVVLQGFKASRVQNNTRYFEVHTSTSTSSSTLLYIQVVGNISRK